MGEPPTRIDATAAVPIDLASKLTLGAREAALRARQRARRDWQRAQLWWDRQHLNPDQVMQLVVLLVYGLVAVVEAVAHRRKNR